MGRQFFFFKYAIHTSNKNRFRKRLATVVCAGAIAFCAMCGGYLQNFSAAQDHYIKNVSERQLVVFSRTSSDGYYSGVNEPISLQEVKEIYNVKQTETVMPVVCFVTIPQMTGGVCKYSSLMGYSEEEIQKELRFSFSYTNRNGLFVKVNPDAIAELNIGDTFSGNYSVLSYAIDHYYDPRCDILDLTVEKGAYLTRRFADQVGITDEMLNGLTLNFEILIPISSGQSASFLETTVSDGTSEGYWERMNANYYEKATVKTKVRGIFDDHDLDPNIAGTRAAIFMQGDEMLRIVKEHLDPQNRNMQTLTDAIVSGITPDYYNNFPVKPTVSTEYTVQCWAPEAYYVVAEDITALEQVKEDLLKINPNFSIHQEIQDYQAGKLFISNSRGILFYISYSVLAVVLLLTALIYAGLIDKRKFEFAVLRANGLTKKEVRKVIYSEMLLEFVRIFLTGIAFSGLIYLVADVWLGYPFCYDWMTILWLTIISLGAIILPTVISLFFVNKFEPDEVMRNEVR